MYEEAKGTGFIRLLLGRRITVSVPSAAFQFESTKGHDLFGFSITFRAGDLFGAQFDKPLGNMTAFTFKFIYRHKNLIESCLLDGGIIRTLPVKSRMKWNRRPAQAPNAVRTTYNR